MDYQWIILRISQKPLKELPVGVAGGLPAENLSAQNPRDSPRRPVRSKMHFSSPSPSQREERGGVRRPMFTRPNSSRPIHYNQEPKLIYFGPS
jgi:hypothetical protein